MRDDPSHAPQRICAVVDDDASVRDSLAILLETHGIEARLYGSGAAFLTAPDRRVHCLIVDQHMPGLTLLDIIEALQREGLTIPAVLITGCLDAGTALRGQRLRVPVLEKPFGAARLLALLDAECADRQG